MTKKIILWIATFVLVYEFGSKGIQSLMQNAEITTLISSVGFLSAHTTLFAIGVGILDCAVALLLLFYWRARRPWLLLYAALWPLVPATLRVTHGMDFEITEVGLIMVSAVVAYVVGRKQSVPAMPAPASAPQV